MSNYLYLYVNCPVGNSKDLQKILAHFGFILVLQEKPIKVGYVERLFGTINQKNLLMAAPGYSIASLTIAEQPLATLLPESNSLILEMLQRCYSRS